MRPDPIILIVEDDEGHALLIRQNLEEAGLSSPIRHFCDGQAALDFFFDGSGHPVTHPGCSYVVLLDIRMPKVDGIEVLRRLKQDRDLRRLPIVMLTTADDMRDVERCYALGCSAYIQKPVDYEHFAEAMRRIGLFTQLLLVPVANGV